MIRRISVWVLIASLVLPVYGCASSRAYQRQEIERLRSRVAQLESEIALRDKKQRETQEFLEKEVQGSRLAQERLSVGVRSGVKVSAETVKDIQSALKSAGYDPGPVDGKFGEKTKEAVIAFQKANGLAPDGVVGNKTWAKLSAYLKKGSLR